MKEKSVYHLYKVKGTLTPCRGKIRVYQSVSKCIKMIRKYTDRQTDRQTDNIYSVYRSGVLWFNVLDEDHTNDNPGILGVYRYSWLMNIMPHIADLIMSLFVWTHTNSEMLDFRRTVFWFVQLALVCLE